MFGRLSLGSSVVQGLEATELSSLVVEGTVKVGGSMVILMANIEASASARESS